MKNVEALKKLYEAINGSIGATESDNTIAEVIDHLASLMGDVMANTAELLSPYVITLTPTSASAGTSDVTAAEIMEAFSAGRRIQVNGIFDDADQTLFPVAISLKDGQIAICCMGLVEPAHTLIEAMMPWSDDDDNSWILVSYTLTPDA